MTPLLLLAARRPLRTLGAADDRDPTRTVALRRRFAQDASGRLLRLRADLRRGVVERDAFGLRAPLLAPPGPDVLSAPAARAWAASWDPRKVELFQAWLREQHEAGLLEVTLRPGAPGPEPWSNTYVRSAYQRGMAEAEARMRRAGLLPGAAPEGALATAFHQPFHAQRVAMLYTRTFDALRGVSEAMGAQMSRELATGLAAGDGPETIARRLADRVDKIGITRARLIARTEVVAAHSMGALGEYERAEAVVGEPVNVKWWTARDERVRSSHRARHGKVYTRVEAQALLHEPNCRCGLLPAVGEDPTPGRPLRRG